jgi:hypothetical protein
MTGLTRSMFRRRVPFAATLMCGTLAALVLLAPIVHAQGRGAGRLAQPPTGEQPVTPGEIQQMFDAYVAMQAEDVLKLNEEQYPRFLTRLRALQAVRRRGENQRMQIINQLRRSLNGPDGRVDETMIRDRLKMLSDQQAAVGAEVKQAQDSLDEVLDIRQQARFRIFEEEMERRKVELVMRTRQANRPNVNRPPREF